MGTEVEFKLIVSRTKMTQCKEKKTKEKRAKRF